MQESAYQGQDTRRLDSLTTVPFGASTDSLSEDISQIEVEAANSLYQELRGKLEETKLKGMTHMCGVVNAWLDKFADDPVAEAGLDGTIKLLLTNNRQLHSLKLDLAKAESDCAARLKITAEAVQYQIQKLLQELSKTIVEPESSDLFQAKRKHFDAWSAKKATELRKPVQKLQQQVEELQETCLRETEAVVKRYAGPMDDQQCFMKELEMELDALDLSPCDAVSPSIPTGQPASAALKQPPHALASPGGANQAGTVSPSIPASATLQQPPHVLMGTVSPAGQPGEANQAGTVSPSIPASATLQQPPHVLVGTASPAGQPCEANQAGTVSPSIPASATLQQPPHVLVGTASPAGQPCEANQAGTVSPSIPASATLQQPPHVLVGTASPAGQPGEANQAGTVSPSIPASATLQQPPHVLVGTASPGEANQAGTVSPSIPASATLQQPPHAPAGQPGEANHAGTVSKSISPGQHELNKAGAASPPVALAGPSSAVNPASPELGAPVVSVGTVSSSIPAADVPLSTASPASDVPVSPSIPASDAMSPPIPAGDVPVSTVSPSIHASDVLMSPSIPAGNVPLGTMIPACDVPMGTVSPSIPASDVLMSPSIPAGDVPMGTVSPSIPASDVLMSPSIPAGDVPMGTVSPSIPAGQPQNETQEYEETTSVPKVVDGLGAQAGTREFHDVQLYSLFLSHPCSDLWC